MLSGKCANLPKFINFPDLSKTLRSFHEATGDDYLKIYKIPLPLQNTFDIVQAVSVLPYFMCLGIPGQIVELTDQENYLATVNIGGVQRQVNIACIVDDEHSPEDCVGDWVLVHVGFAMNRLDEEEAAETLDMLSQMEMVQ